MSNYDELFSKILNSVENITNQDKTIPLGISNRHIHLSREIMENLFGEGYELTKLKDLAQPGQYACKETLTICGPKGPIEKVRVLGPLRSKTQVEILKGDSFKLGIKGVTRMSGDLEGSPGLTLIGPNSSVRLEEGVIVAKRHIHMSLEDAREFGLEDGDLVDIEVGEDLGGIFKNVAIRASDNSALECHLDMEEANAMNLGSRSRIRILK